MSTSPFSRVLRLAVVAALVATAPSLPAQTTRLGEDVDGLLAWARERNPEVQTMRHEADAARLRTASAGALPDPMLRVELQNLTNAGSDAAPSLLPNKVGQTKYTVSQSLPFWGKRDLRQGIAEADALQAERRIGATWAELAARIKGAYAQYLFVARNEDLAREVLALMGSLERLAQSRYATGLAPQQDVIRAQVEITGMRGELVMLEAERRRWQVKLNGLLARPGDAELAVPLRPRPVPPPARLTLADLRERLAEGNPQLAVEAARIDSAERSRALTYRNRYPDFTVGISPIQMGSRIAEWELMLEVNIPLQQGARRAQEHEAESMLSAARSRREAARLQLEADLGEQLAALDAARRTADLIAAELLPQASLTLSSALAAYETGRVDFATLLEAQRQIRKARQDRNRAETETQMRLAEVERLIGADL